MKKTEIKRHTSLRLLMVERANMSLYYQVVNLGNWTIEFQSEDYTEAYNWFWANERKPILF